WYPRASSCRRGRWWPECRLRSSEAAWTPAGRSALSRATSKPHATTARPCAASANRGRAVQRAARALGRPGPDSGVRARLPAVAAGVRREQPLEHDHLCPVEFVADGQLAALLPG